MGGATSQVTEVVEGYKAAVHAKNLDALIELYDDNVRVFDAWGVWCHEGAAAWRSAARQWFESLGIETVSVKFEDVQVIGRSSFAMLNATITYTGFSAVDEELRSLQNRLTWSLMQRGEAWKIVHEHTSAPVGFGDLKAILRRDAIS
jgi:ketosteroid isomerase-like protein